MRNRRGWCLRRELAAGDRRRAPMNSAISTWSGAIVCVPPRSRFDAWMRQHVGADALDAAPSATKKRAEVLDMGLAGRVADHRRAVGQHGGHDVRSRWPSPRARQRKIDGPDAIGAAILKPRRARPRAERAESVQVRVEPPAPDDVPARGRHERVAEARQQRPREQERARIRSASSRVDLEAVEPPAWMQTSLAAEPFHLRAEVSRSASIASTSAIRGTLRSTTGSSVKRQAARIGRAPFLLPAGTIVPESGTPPSMTNFSI